MLFPRCGRRLFRIVRIRFLACLIVFLLSSTLALFMLLASPYWDNIAKSKHDVERIRALRLPNGEGIINAADVKSAQLVDEKDVPIAEQIAVVVIAAKRQQAIKNHLNQLKRLRPSAKKFPIVISQDGEEASVTEIIKQFVLDTPNTRFIHHKDRVQPKSLGSKNYFYIAQHYKWALDKVFGEEMGFQTVIVTEDDLDIASDFFSYFSATKRLLYEDPTIWCVSAWNDNGAPTIADWQNGTETLYRTDFFPGLGWMLTSKLWKELSPNWPEYYWDDWMRQQQVRKDRVCVRPEISRTVHNMSVAGKGSSNGLFKAFLASIRLPEHAVDFSRVDINRLQKERFDEYFWHTVKATKEISLKELLENTPKLASNSAGSTAYRVVYKDPREYRRIAQKFKLMSDVRSGMLRTAYYGIVPFFSDGIRFFAVHPSLDLSRPFNKGSSGVYHSDWDKMSKYLDFAELYCNAKRWTGKCDPKDPGMVDWFRKKGWAKRLEAWGEMTVF